MGKETVFFKTEERKALADVVDFLYQLADRLAQNEVTLQQGSDKLKLSIPKHVVLELKVQEEITGRIAKHSLELDIEWTEGDQGAGGVRLG